MKKKRSNTKESLKLKNLQTKAKELALNWNWKREIIISKSAFVFENGRHCYLLYEQDAVVDSALRAR